RPVRRIAGEPLRPETKSLFGPLNHCSGGTHLGLADGARRLDIDNHSVLHIDQIVVGIGEKRLALGGRPSIGPPDRTGRRTSAEPRSPRRTLHRSASQGTPSPRGSLPPDRYASST